MKRLLWAALALGSVIWTASAGDVVKALLAPYEALEAMSCEVRKTTESDGRKIRALSRVYFQRPDRLHVENILPLRRRYVADGQRLFYYIEGDAKGFSRTIEDLPEDWLRSLRTVPSSPMDPLLRIADGEETRLKSSQEGFVRLRVARDDLIAILTVEEPFNRLRKIEFFHETSEESASAVYVYDHFLEPVPGVWLPTLHKVTATIGSANSVETSRFGNLSVNEPISAALFDPEAFFEDVEFTGDFEEIYGR
jgi:hypothetical protein